MRRWGGRRATALVQATLATYGTRCHLCGRDGADSADHVVPRSLGGPDELANLRPAHRSCNFRRGNLPLAEWRRRFPIASRVELSRSSRWE
ncbi:HNH endonuclease [Corynebacterium striatum]|uniref:HNH endonuclease n=1 Tax=Corynebacterium striatum TaxID=43770 RepID=UPI003B5AAF24